ncbi:mediator complex, subunit Med18 [Xylariaceae sp. FL1272]|nr:mediator complex, subunit Med18 [Xylariaceae sp. FL1272]
MHEIFLTAAVKSTDFDMACAVLSGLTWMKARRTVYRILFFAGQPQPKGLPAIPPQTVFHRDRLQPDRQLWAELSKQLLRASYILQVAYEIPPDTGFGKNASMDFAALPATLRWTDMPDPLRDSPITSRKKIEIPLLRGVPNILHEIKHTYTHELIQETYSFIKGDVEIVFSRHYHLPDSPSRPVQHMPAFGELRPVDSALKWVLNVKMNVTEDSQPDKLRKANEELMRVKAEFDKLFDFKLVDRRVFDTRIAQLPQVPGRGPP